MGDPAKTREEELAELAELEELERIEQMELQSGGPKTIDMDPVQIQGDPGPLPSRTEAGIDSAVRGATFGMSPYVSAAGTALGSQLGDSPMSYDDALTRERSLAERARRAYPETGALETMGGMSSGAGMARQMAPTVAAQAGLGGAIGTVGGAAESGGDPMATAVGGATGGLLGWLGGKMMANRVARQGSYDNQAAARSQALSTNQQRAAIEAQARTRYDVEMARRAAAEQSARVGAGAAPSGPAPQAPPRIPMESVPPAPSMQTAWQEAGGALKEAAPAAIALGRGAGLSGAMGAMAGSAVGQSGVGGMAGAAAGALPQLAAHGGKLARGFTKPAYAAAESLGAAGVPQALTGSAIPAGAREVLEAKMSQKSKDSQVNKLRVAYVSGDLSPQLKGELQPAIESGDFGQLATKMRELAAYPELAGELEKYMKGRSQ